MLNRIKYIVVTVITFLVIFTGCQEEKTQISLEKQEDGSTQQSTVVSEDSIYVYVSGQVKNPGVYCLKSSDRVFMAIDKAGGLTDKAQKTGIDMAKVLEDGQNLIILSQKEYERSLKEKNEKFANDESSDNSTSGKEATEGSLVNINTADISQLTTLSGIGETRAKAIIAYREENGDFKSKEDIKNVSGIGKSTYSNIEKMITVN